MLTGEPGSTLSEHEAETLCEFVREGLQDLLAAGLVTAQPVEGWSPNEYSHVYTACRVQEFGGDKLSIMLPVYLFAVKGLGRMLRELAREFDCKLRKRREEEGRQTSGSGWIETKGHRRALIVYPDGTSYEGPFDRSLYGERVCPLFGEVRHCGDCNGYLCPTMPALASESVLGQQGSGEGSVEGG